MILLRILTRDFLRTKGVMLVVFAFVMLSALLMAGGTGLVVQLQGALDALFDAAKVPDYVQMHAGDLDRSQIEEWAMAHPLVRAHQTVEMITVDGGSLHLGDRPHSEDDTIMDISFVRPNTEFDLLLDGDNEPLAPAPGEIGVPVYFMDRNDLAPGDRVTVDTGKYAAAFTIIGPVRDAQMNPAIVHSKRFVIHEEDYGTLRQHVTETEYLIEFLLTDPERTEEFAAAYEAAGLPARGPAVDQNLFRMLNALTDGIVAAVVVILSVLLMVIAILCLRFTILASIEEDYREIGVMKAIGMHHRHIRRIYLAKYLALGAGAAAVGYFLSIPLGRLLQTNMLSYLGSASPGPMAHLLPVGAAGLVFLIVALSSTIILRRFHRISAVDALRSAGSDGRVRGKASLPVSRARRINVNAFLGFRDVLQRFRLYGLLCFIFFFAAFTIIIPVHFLATITAPSFVSYMGIGRSDIRIDLRQTEGVAGRFDDMIATLRADPEVELASPLVTSRYTLVRDNGEEETIAIETGDFSLFPLDYLEGAAPLRFGEIALSHLNAQDMERRPGDTVTIILDGRPTPLTVSGIYQDVTNGGRTAKAVLPRNGDDVLWYAVSINLFDGADAAAKKEKKEEYAAAFAPARVTDLDGYMAQTLGDTVRQLRLVTIVAVVVGIGVSVLITSLFMRMLISKDRTRISIMRSIGFSLRDIRTQYLTMALTVLAIGIVAGTLFSNTLGQRLVSALWAFMGAARITFVINPLQAYLLLPALLMGAVAATTRSALTGIKESFGGTP
jgi:putative ABC transport system permease protein